MGDWTNIGNMSRSEPPMEADREQLRPSAQARIAELEAALRWIIENDRPDIGRTAEVVARCRAALKTDAKGSPDA